MRETGFNPLVGQPAFLVQEAVARQPGMPRGAALLYGRMARFASGGGTCYASVKYLAAELAAGRRTVESWLASLVQAKFVKRRWVPGYRSKVTIFLPHPAFAPRPNGGKPLQIPLIASEEAAGNAAAVPLEPAGQSRRNQRTSNKREFCEEHTAATIRGRYREEPVENEPATPTPPGANAEIPPAAAPLARRGPLPEPVAIDSPSREENAAERARWAAAITVAAEHLRLTRRKPPSLEWGQDLSVPIGAEGKEGQRG